MPRGTGPSRSRHEPGSRDWRREGAAATIAISVFGVAGAFIQVQNEPSKIWNMAAALLLSLSACAAYLWWTRRTGVIARWRRRPGRTATTLVMAAAVCTLLLAAVVSISPGGRPEPAAGPEDPAEEYMHEIMPSSRENDPVDLEGEIGWAMTSFRVTMPYLKSIEVAAAPDGKVVLLSVHDEHDREIASGEPVIRGYRAKFTFTHLKDVSPYLGSKLYLKVTNIHPGQARVYFTKGDHDAGTTSYLPCPMPRPIDCPNPEAQDLSALVVGRRG